MKIDCSKTETYFAEKARLTKQNPRSCHELCTDCPLNSVNNGKELMCTEFEMFYPKEAIEIVQKWSDEHPQKTKKEAFLEAYPNAIIDKIYPVAHPCEIYGLPEGVEWSVDLCVECKGCANVWDEPAEEENGRK